MNIYQDTGPTDCTTPVDVSSLIGKTAIVTGGARGIGAAYVHALAGAGATVVVGDVDEAAGLRLVSESEFPSLIFVKCDVTQWKDQKSLFQQAVEASQHRRVDIVVANAGISGPDSVFLNENVPAGQEPEEPDLKILNINLIGVMYTTKLALHYFQMQFGATESTSAPADTCLILQGSLAGFVDQPSSPQYNASKFALRGVIRSLRRTTWQHNTRVNYVAPWYIKTVILSDAVAERITSKGAVFARIEDAAAALLKIASDKQLNGRAIGIVPRMWAPLGYLDIDHDDYVVGDRLREWQEIVLKTSHRLAGAPVG